MENELADSGVIFDLDFGTLDEDFVTECLNTDLFLSPDVNNTNYYKLKSKPMGDSPTSTFKSASSRTNLKLLLSRDQLFNEESRSQKTASSTTGAASSTADNSNSLPVRSDAPNAAATSAVTVPTRTRNLFPAMKDVPKDVLTVYSLLENPTKYHVVAEQQRQLKNFLTDSDHNGGHHDDRLLVHSMPSAVATSGTASTVLHQTVPYMSSSAPGSPNSVALSSSAATSASEADVIDSIISMQAEMDSESNPFAIQAASKSILYKIKSTPSSKSTGVDPSTYAATQYEQYSRERQKKDNHNRIERRRRYNINDRIKELADLLPKSETQRVNKGTILKESVDYIKQINKIKSDYERESEERKRLAADNRRLKLLLAAHQQENQCHRQDLSSLDMNNLFFEECVTVKQEPLDDVGCDSVFSITRLDDIMDDDHHFVTGDPMMAPPTDDQVTIDDMDYTS